MQAKETQHVVVDILTESMNTVLCNEKFTETRRESSAKSIVNIPELEIRDTRELIDKFQRERLEEKKKRLVYVAIFSAFLIIFGMLGSVLDFVFILFSGLEYDYTAANVCFLLLFLCYTTGIVALSTCFNEALDADEVLERPGSIFEYVRYLLSFSFFIISCAPAGFPPYLGILISLSAILMAFRPFYNGYFWFDRFTYKLDFYMIGWIIVFDYAFLYGAFMNVNESYRDSLSSLYLLVPLPPYPDGHAVFVPFFLISFLLTILIVYTLRICYIEHKLYWSTNGRSGSGATKIAVLFLYSFLIGISICLIFLGTMLLYYEKYPPGGDFQNGLFKGYAILIVGLEFLIPPLLVLLVGRTRLFNYIANQFDSDRHNLERDGAFISDLLDHIPMQIGDSWWVHYDKCNREKNSSYDQSNFMHYWYEGKICQLEETQMTVLLKNSTDEEEFWCFDLKITSTDSNQLLDDAKENLRCIDWENMSVDLFLISVRDTSSKPYFTLSRKVRPNERIDYFISHSWSDDGTAKYNKLKELSDWHFLKYYRYPTFWFDKVCIDQNNIGLGLKVLPINVMACRWMLILCGSSYTSRLWCVWEIFTLFAFASIDTAVERLKIYPLSDVDDNVMEKLLSFDVKLAHCYDPNEEKKLRSVIEANGDSNFNARVQDLARKSLNYNIGVHQEKQL